MRGKSDVKVGDQRRCVKYTSRTWSENVHASILFFHRSVMVVTGEVHGILATKLTNKNADSEIKYRNVFEEKTFVFAAAVKVENFDPAAKRRWKILSSSRSILARTTNESGYIHFGVHH